MYQDPQGVNPSDTWSSRNLS